MVKSSENEKSFVPHPPHIMFLSAEFMDSLKHMSGVLTFPILSIFKGAAPLHFATKRKHIEFIRYMENETLQFKLSKDYFPIQILK